MKKYDIKFKNWKCNIEYGQYGTGATALSLIDHVDGEPVATASVNLMKEDIDPRIRVDVQSSAELPKDHVYIKTWSENEGMVEALIEAGIVVSQHKVVPVGPYGSQAVEVKILNMPQQ